MKKLFSIKFTINLLFIHNNLSKTINLYQGISSKTSDVTITEYLILSDNSNYHYLSLKVLSVVFLIDWEFLSILLRASI